MATNTSAAEKRARYKYYRSMSSEELGGWLNEQGLGEKDRKAVEEEGFTGESFLLMNDDVMKTIGIKMAGRMLLKNLVEKAKLSCVEEETVSIPQADVATGSSGRTNNLDAEMREDPPSTSPMVPSTTITNDLSSDTRSSSQQYTNEMRESTPQEAESDMSRVQENEDTGREDNLRVEEESGPIYCTSGPYEGSSVFSYDQAVYMYRDKVWAGRQVLRVFFLNPELLTRWGLDTDTILCWAMAWREPDNELIPIFQECSTVKKADIRVKFSESEGSWCLVGMDAEKITAKDKPTMVLNLRGYSQHVQRSLVIHEFGHALGLDHEHQRSDFWDVVEKYFNKNKIPSNQMMRIRKTDDMVEKEAFAYDHESIMHFWFDINWLKAEYRDDSRVRTANGLSRTDRAYLQGLHRRQKDGMLPTDPSNEDLRHLLYIYQNFGPTEIPTARPPMMPSLSMAQQPSMDISPVEQRPLPSRRSSITVLRANTHLRGIMNALWEIRAYWKEIGRGLQFSIRELDTLEGDAGRKLESILVKWMQSGNATIDQLLGALRSSLMHKHDLADQIERTRGRDQRRALGLE